MKIKRREFFRRAVFGSTAAAALPAMWSAATKDRPNFVFILADDLGWKDLACFGSSFYETPNLDRLAASGMRFTDAYAACPVCSPTRASIMTGRYPVHTGVTDFINNTGANQPDKWSRNTRLLPAANRLRLNLEEVTLAETLKQNGYATFFAGKWHLGPEGHYPENQGFDINKGGCEWGAPSGGNRYFSPYGNPRLEDGPAGEHLPERLGRETANFIDAHKNKPFLAYLSFYSVHTPLMARADLKAKYEAKAKLVQFAGERFIPEREREARQVQDHAIYAGMVEAMDQAVGQVLAAVERSGAANRTVVIFTTDNGGLSTSEGSPTSNVPLRGGKGWAYEGGIRVPAIVRAPGVTAPGSICREPVISIDYYPTILQLAGVSPKAGNSVDGISIVPLLKGQPLKRGPIFWHYPHYGNQGGAPVGMIRDGQWKLIEWYEDGQLQLFNLDADISEHYDMVKLYPGKARELHARLQAWRVESKAVMPTPNPQYKAGVPERPPKQSQED
jgi:arylsulfatase A-like enzyme